MTLCPKPVFVDDGWPFGQCQLQHGHVGRCDVTLIDFIVGLPRCNEPTSILVETLTAIARSTRRPSRVIVIDNGDDPMPMEAERVPGIAAITQIARPGINVGCAGAWNLIHGAARLHDATRAIILNADCAVAPDTFEKMLATPAPAVVLAYDFGCFMIDAEIRRRIGPFDEKFYPAYYENSDYCRRLVLAGIEPIRWPLTPVVEMIAPGREKVATGITHGSYNPDGYQGWRGEKLAWFWDCHAKNQARYLAKWGGEPGSETFTTPFDGKPDPS